MFSFVAFMPVKNTATMTASVAITLFHAESSETAWSRARAASVRDTQTLADQTLCALRDHHWKRANVQAKTPALLSTSQSASTLC